MATPHTLITSFSISGFTPAEALLKIDSEISYHETRLLHLRSLRNTIPPIASLPNEILSEIFMQCHSNSIKCVMGPSYEMYSDSDVESDSESESRNSPSDSLGYERLIVSWVSRRWRSAALSHPPLWSSMTNGSLEHARECTIRSRALPLSVDLQRPPISLVRACILQLQRVCSLRVKMREEDDQYYRMLGALMAPSAPHLTSLHLDGFDLRYADHASIPLFERNHPCLKDLTLANCNITWRTSALLASTLTSLTIISPKSRISINALLAWFGSMPFLTTLEHLEFIHCLDTLDDEPPSIGPETKCTLPNLLTITIMQNYRDAHLLFGLLDRFELPRASVRAAVDRYYFMGNGYELYQTARFLDYYREENPFWGKKAVHTVVIRETRHEFSLTVSNPTVPSPSPKLTLCLHHGGWTQDPDTYTGGKTAPLAPMAIWEFPLFSEEIRTLSLTEDSLTDLHGVISTEMSRRRSDDWGNRGEDK
ncbi:hypothetical protein BDN72DRAFT_848667 [Pluteus cervinus]|uniref:Uncharacterized protein n=1 Tax=Pluteus cervinus TaxID=181527 RepID=A0ACD3AA40_9AGAR|nr:hypothetical protein BDN72DRAFT_848667 [Pluteus cervinus]